MIKIFTLVFLLAASPVFAWGVAMSGGSPQAGGGSQETIGNTSVGGTPNSLVNTDIKCSALSTPGTSGTVISISIYSSNDTTSNDVKIGVYDNTGGGVGNLIGSEVEFLNIGTYSEQWKEFSGLSVSVTAGTYYWLCVQQSGSGLTGYQGTSAANSRYNVAHSYNTAWPNPATGEVGGTALYSIKAVVQH